LEKTGSGKLPLLQQSHFLFKLRWLSNPEMKKVSEGLIIRELYKTDPLKDKASPSANDTDFLRSTPLA